MKLTGNVVFEKNIWHVFFYSC